MYRGHKSEQEKEWRKLWTEYSESYSWRKAKEHGHWEEVAPYQNGWTRTFTLRDDISRRNDASAIRRSLDLVNNVRFSRREDFLYYSHKQKKLLPEKQTLGWITVEKYESLDEKLKSLFVKKVWLDKVTYPWKRVIERTGYVVKFDYWFVFKVEPNIITHHWIPDSEFESRRAELHNKIYQGGNWSKVAKAMGWTINGKAHSDRTLFMRNKYGKDLSEKDFDLEDV